MKLKNYQKQAVESLLEQVNGLLKKDGQRVCAFKAPTGSGKTIMLADLLDQFAQQEKQEEYVFLWVSGNQLHAQSKEKLESYLQNSRYTFSLLENINTDEFSQNEIIFINWHSLTKKNREGEWSNVLMRDNEQERNLPTLLRKTKQSGKHVILIVDESHYHYWSDQTQELVQKEINPKLIIEVSATPKMEISNEDIVNKDAGFVSVKLDAVIAEAMIKESIIINANVDQYQNYEGSADEAIIDASLMMRNELLTKYQSVKSQVNPLVLIQLPSEKESMSDLDSTKLDFVKKYLNDKHDINIDNGKLAIWLSGSDNKQNTEGIEHLDNSAEVLIFKQAIALGWDCPRAQILVMFRDIKNVTFEIQTVGRILRMPEAKRYEADLLNSAYIFTNLEKIAIAQDADSKSYFDVKKSIHNATYTSIKLPSIYISRTDYGDLTLSFRKIFIQEANKRFGITNKDIMGEAYKKADKDLELYPEELTKPVIANVLLNDIDNVENIIGDTVEFDIAEDEVKYQFIRFAKLTSLPFVPSRSHTKIQQAIYEWFDGYLGYKNKSRIDIQRVIVCSETNQKIFVEIIERAKTVFKSERQTSLVEKQITKPYIWDVPEIDYFNSLYAELESKNYAHNKCYIKSDRSEPEKVFEMMINNNKSVEWWYKNGVSKERYFAIPYADPSTELQRSFYPDFILQTSDGRIGIFDTKKGFTLESKETEAKANALAEYIKKNKKLKLFGGIINYDSSGLRIFIGNKFTPDLTDSGWSDLKL